MKSYFRFAVLVAVGIILSGAMLPRSAAQANHPTDENAMERWLSGELQEAHSIKPGMTKADLLKVFMPDGGMQWNPTRRFVLRSCNLIKVDVTFQQSEGTHSTNLPARELIIKSISKPYLEYMYAD